MTASIEVPPDADLVAIAEAAGNANMFGRRYQDGRLYVDGVTQAALEAAAASVGVVAPLLVPVCATPRQARLALLQAGLLDQVEQAVQAAGGATLIEWEHATVVNRDHQLVAQIAAAAGLTDAQIDDLFRLAVTL